MLVLRAFQQLVLFEIVTLLGGFPWVRKIVLRTKRRARVARPDAVKNFWMPWISQAASTCARSAVCTARLPQYDFFARWE